MARKITVQARRELVDAIGTRYRTAARCDKLRILDEFVAVTGYHRKHAIRLLNDAGTAGKQSEPRVSSRGPVYDGAVREALVVLWEAADRVCGKRLKPLLPVLVQALERHGHVHLDGIVRDKVLSISAATIDRVLAPTRAAVNGGNRAARRAKPAIRRSIPVRTFADWGSPLPGFMEGDLVCHGGETAAGSFAHTLVLTDIASGWTECVALAVREATLIVEALSQLRTTMPFPLRGFDTDNGSEFVNEAVLAYCTESGIELTRSRPYRKNDQAWVEQKNGSVVRRLVGYRRLEGMAAAEALARLYASSRLFVNFFQPSFKLAEKLRVGSRVHKRYHPPETPCARLLASEAVPEDMKGRLRRIADTLDPLRLLEEIRAVQHHLAALSSGATPHTPPQRDGGLDGFLKGLATAWQGGEVRETHRSKPRPQRDWRTRTDPFEAEWSRVRAWFDADPDRTGKELFQRLQAERPSVFRDGQLRTFQRTVKVWRRAAARRLVFGGSPNTGCADNLGPAPPVSTCASPGYQSPPRAPPPPHA
jgi:Integrase core domain